MRGSWRSWSDPFRVHLLFSCQLLIGHGTLSKDLQPNPGQVRRGILGDKLWPLHPINTQQLHAEIQTLIILCTNIFLGHIFCFVHYHREVKVINAIRLKTWRFNLFQRKCGSEISSGSTFSFKGPKTILFFVKA